MYYQQPTTLILEGYGLAPGTTREKGYFQKNWVGVSAARFLKPLPYFWPKSVVFPTLLQTW